MTADAEVIARLRAFPTPTIANALESLGLDPGSEFMDATVSMLTPRVPQFVGRAVTARISSLPPEKGAGPAIPVESWWRHVASRQPPTIVVVEDIDPRPHGAMWGEVMGHLHRALGVTGIITNGAARDIDELVALGFPIIGGRVSPSHAHARFLDVDVSVRIGGLVVEPGDLLHADQHGVHRIPASVPLDQLAATAGLIEGLERELFAAADRPSVGVEDFLETWASVRGRWPQISQEAGSTDVI